jgi:hypothetical protein
VQGGDQEPGGHRSLWQQGPGDLTGDVLAAEVPDASQPQQESLQGPSAEAVAAPAARKAAKGRRGKAAKPGGMGSEQAKQHSSVADAPARRTRHNAAA